jgi:hypothetical protein
VIFLAMLELYAATEIAQMTDDPLIRCPLGE